jgi:quinolinate synthase
MLRYPETDDTPVYIVATEVGLLTGLRTRYPERAFVAASDFSVCANMKLSTLEGAIAALRDGLNEVTVPDDIREKALRAVTRMVEEPGRRD